MNFILVCLIQPNETFLSTPCSSSPLVSQYTFFFVRLLTLVVPFCNIWHLTFLRCVALLYFAIRLESRKSANKRIYRIYLLTYLLSVLRLSLTAAKLANAQFTPPASQTRGVNGDGDGGIPFRLLICRCSLVVWYE